MNVPSVPMFPVYNPTRCSSPTTNCGEATWGVSSYQYDALSRTTKLIEPDGSAVNTSYTGNCTTVTDEAGNQRKSCSDALGRLTGVWEAPNLTSTYNYETDYAYDALNDLLNVTQKGGSTSSTNWRTRTFTYDWLSRLLCAANPEVQIVTCPTSATGTFPTGAITYTYDLDGNLATRVEPKAGQTGTQQTTHNYTYDALNRLTKESHLDPNSGQEEYAYDGNTLTSGCGQNPPTITATNVIGRRSAMCGQESGSSWSFDSMGRPLLESTRNYGSAQKVLSVNYTYYLDGSLKTLTYPSGDVVTYAVGGAGRATQVNDSSNNFVGYPGNAATYAPTGALATMTNGYTSSPAFAGIVTSNLYNLRMQPILLSASVSSNAIFSLCYDFHLGVAISKTPCSFSAYATGDNGSVFQIVNNADTTRSSAYIYDPLNRIAQAYTTNTSSPNCWGETYSATPTAPGVLPSTPGIDAWGNLINRSGVSGMAGNCTTEGLSASATGQNQLSGIGVVYDAAGNVTNDGSGNTPTYDAEDRISTDQGYTYYYDADGVRMEKTNGSTGTMYWPGPGGEILAETSLTGTINEEYVYFNGERIARIDRPTGTVNYYFSNHLGSASVITSATGVIQEQMDFYPFGGVAYSSGSDPNHYKFTGKERDTESGLDNFGARYDASSMGRFMTPDPLGGHSEDPQTLNRYAYVRNNPLSLTDPTGLDFYLKCQSSDNSGCTQVQIDPNNAKSQTWVQADSNGNATIVTSDSIRAGQNTATVNENGVQINGNNQGVYFDNPASHTTDANGHDVNNNPIDVAGSGKLQDFNFHIDSNCGGTCWTAGNWSFMGRSYGGISDLLDRRGAFTIFGEDAVAFLGYGAHPFSTQHRFGGPLNSPHLSVPYDQPGMVPIDPLANVPRTGGFHVDPHSDTLGHAEDVHRGAVPE